ncbi:MAG: hypothetical protein JRG89_03340 [Deltaproteobacteria bacterium]|nr:hypothetical protein [Deltaproteobacteria bacterium]MBW2387449.1 hypothetical protein [Deltaproteobacteria bacterium]
MIRARAFGCSGRNEERYLTRDPGRAINHSMQTFVATLFLFCLMAAGMAVGVIFSNRELRGSCGGTGEDCSCSAQKQRECAHKKEHEAHAPAN